MSDTTEEVLAEVQLSRVYFLVLARTMIGGREPALALKVRHEGDDGRITYRGGFLIPLRKLDEVLHSLDRIRGLL